MYEKQAPTLPQKSYKIFCIDSIPKDAELYWVYFDTDTNQVKLLFEHESFGEEE